MIFRKDFKLKDNTGTHKLFIPLFTESQIVNEYQIQAPPQNFPEEIRSELQEFADASENISQNFVEDFLGIAMPNRQPWQSSKKYSYIQYRTGTKKLIIGRSEIVILGIWLLIETNWGNTERGYRISTHPYKENHEKLIRENPEYHPEVPYITQNADYFFTNEDGTAKKTPISLSIENDGQYLLDLELELVWIVQQSEWQSTDLIVDLGNTRTVALLMDSPEYGTTSYGRISSFRRYCRPLILAPTDDVYVQHKNSLNNAIIDTWFLLCKPPYETPSFEYWEKTPQPKSSFWWLKPKIVSRIKTIYECIPHMFTKIAPVVCGDEAKQMYTLPLANKFSDLQLLYEQSSPKRYYWQNKKVDTNWCMLLRENDIDYERAIEQTDAAPHKIGGEITRFMPTDGSILPADIDFCDNVRTFDNQPASTRYPRSSTLTWFLINILEKAWEQVNMDSPASKLRPKYIGRVLGTYPSGWTPSEIELYRKRWQEAIDIFHRTHFPEKDKEIELDLSLDEAMAGQVPFLVGEISLVNNNMKAWLEVTGKKKEDGSFRTRIMNIDIGGGTTDIAILEHSHHPKAAIGTVGIDCRLLSKECFTIAGDAIVKDIIEKIIVPRFGGTTPEKLSDNIQNHEMQRRVRAVRGCLIPIANMILKNIMSEGGSEVSISQCCNKTNLDVLNELLGSARDMNFSINYEPEDVNQIVRDLFDDLIQRCAFYAYAYDVDFIFLSGKPSELPVVRELFERYSGLPTDRIISAQNFMVGDWYPFGDGQFIGDAKSVTAVGCAIRYALNNGRIEGWKIYNAGMVPVKNEWCVLSSGLEGTIEPAVGGELLDFEADEMADFICLEIGAHIARRQNTMFDYEPVYKLTSKNQSLHQVLVKFKRVTKDGSDALEITEAKKEVNNDELIDISLNDLELSIWPCSEEYFQFWQDSGQLDICK